MVIEVKYGDFAPVWFTDILLKNKINASSHSKYAKGFENVFD